MAHGRKHRKSLADKHQTQRFLSPFQLPTTGKASITSRGAIMKTMGLSEAWWLRGRTKAEKSWCGPPEGCPTSCPPLQNLPQTICLYSLPATPVQRFIWGKTSILFSIV